MRNTELPGVGCGVDAEWGALLPFSPQVCSQHPESYSLWPHFPSKELCQLDAL